MSFTTIRCLKSPYIDMIGLSPRTRRNTTEATENTGNLCKTSFEALFRTLGTNFIRHQGAFEEKKSLKARSKCIECRAVGSQH